ncbi:MAG TPA: hypothetical protein PLP47_06490 [Methanofastidiosum sp.]|nr:hypothetical protein [Methanofastidiosum sp.]
MFVRIVEYLSWAIGVIGILVIFYGSIISIIKFIKIEDKRFKGKMSLSDVDSLRLTLGHIYYLDWSFL